MRTLQLRISGRWAQFRKPETNNNPLTHDFITKTALIGLMGAVLGKERKSEMRALFPQLSEDLLYGVQVNGVVKKESWSFTLRSASSYFAIYERRNIKDLRDNRAPKQMEFLRDPDFKVTLALKNERSTVLFDAFTQAVREGEACFTPVLGLHNCPAELEFIGESHADSGTGKYSTKGFVLRHQEVHLSLESGNLRIGYERIPSFQDNDWWNHPDRYCEVIYPSNQTVLQATGEHFMLKNGESWCLI